MSKPDDVSRDAPQRASPDNSIKLAHVDDGVTSPETRPKLAAQAGEHLVHVTVGMPTTSEGLPDAEQVQRVEGGIAQPPRSAGTRHTAGLPTTRPLQRPARPGSDEACRLAFQGHRPRQESGLRQIAPRRPTCWLLHLGRKRQQGLDSTPPRARDTGPLVANITPQPCREQLSPACGWPADCDTGSSPGGHSTRRCDQREYEVPGGCYY